MAGIVSATIWEKTVKDSSIVTPEIGYKITMAFLTPHLNLGYLNKKNFFRRFFSNIEKDLRCFHIFDVSLLSSKCSNLHDNLACSYAAILRRNHFEEQGVRLRRTQ